MLAITQRILLDGKPGIIVGFGDDGEVDVDMADGTKRWLYWAPHRIEIIEAQSREAA